MRGARALHQFLGHARRRLPAQGAKGFKPISPIGAPLWSSPAGVELRPRIPGGARSHTNEHGPWHPVGHYYGQRTAPRRIETVFGGPKVRHSIAWQNGVRNGRRLIVELASGRLPKRKNSQLPAGGRHKGNLKKKKKT